MTRTKITGVCTGALVLTMMATLGVGRAHAQADYDAAVTTALLTQDFAALQQIADDWRDGRWDEDDRWERRHDNGRWDNNGRWDRDDERWEQRPDNGRHNGRWDRDDDDDRWHRNDRWDNNGRWERDDDERWGDGRWDRDDRWDRDGRWDRDRWDEDEWERDEDEWERDEDEWERDEDEWERDEDEWGDEWTLRLPAQKDLVLVAHGGRHWGGHGFSRDCPRYERDYCPRYDGYRDGRDYSRDYGRDYYGQRHHYDYWS